MNRDGIVINDKQLACARINSKEGQNYLAGKLLYFTGGPVIPEMTG